ncbi:MAG: hypothetical protein SOY04_12650 [Clostridium celatum]|nr:hypothetical protein [Clostridium celatum]
MENLREAICQLNEVCTEVYDKYFSSEDIEEDIYNALVDKVLIDTDFITKDVTGEVIEKGAIIDEEYSLSYKLNEDKLYLQKNYVDVIEIKKDGKFLTNLLDFIDEAMRV